jgi:hypothetical protein
MSLISWYSEGQMSGYLVGYARTSTEEQQAGLEAQVSALKAAGCKKVLQERVSSIGQRKELETALSFVREGDTFVVTKLDRLARSTQHALSIVEDLERRGVGLRILDFGGEPIATKSPHGKLVLTMFAAFAEFERRLMLERVWSTTRHPCCRVLRGALHHRLRDQLDLCETLLRGGEFGARFFCGGRHGAAHELHGL